MASRTVLATSANVLVTVAIVAAYHFLLAPKGPAGPAATSPSPSPSPAAPASSGLPGLAAAPDFARFEALERRVAMVERALSNAAALAPGVVPAPVPEAGSGGARPAAAVWTEDQLSAFRAMLAEVEMRKRQESYAAQMRDVIRRTAKQPLSQDQETQALALLVAFQRKVAEIYPEGSGGQTAEARAASDAAAESARGALEDEIRRILPADVAERVLSMVPHYPPRLPTSHVTPPPPSMGDGK